MYGVLVLCVCSHHVASRGRNGVLLKVPLLQGELGQELLQFVVLLLYSLKQTDTKINMMKGAGRGVYPPPHTHTLLLPPCLHPPHSFSDTSQVLDILRIVLFHKAIFRGALRAAIKWFFLPLCHLAPTVAKGISTEV